MGLWGLQAGLGKSRLISSSVFRWGFNRWGERPGPGANVLGSKPGRTTPWPMAGGHWGPPRSRTLTPLPSDPAGPAPFRDPHLRLTAPHAPDGEEGGHRAGQGRPREGDREQGRPLQPSLPGGARRSPPGPLTFSLRQAQRHAVGGGPFSRTGADTRGAHSGQPVPGGGSSKGGALVVDSGVRLIAGFGGPRQPAVASALATTILF